KESLSEGSYTQTSLASDLSYPQGIAVDGDGNVYISDNDNSRVVIETPSAGSYTQSQLISNLYNPKGLAVDGSGIVYIAASGTVDREDFADPPALSFATTNRGLISTDSPQTVTLSNLGNTPLKISGVSFPRDFSESKTGTGDCKPGTQLAESASCPLDIDFSPVAQLGNVTSVELSESVTVTTNTLNA